MTAKANAPPGWAAFLYPKSRKEGEHGKPISFSEREVDQAEP